MFGRRVLFCEQHSYAVTLSSDHLMLVLLVGRVGGGDK